MKPVSDPTPVTYPTDTGPRPAVLAAPGEPRGAVLLVHENQGLTPYIRGVVEAIAGEGWMVLAPDLMSRLPAELTAPTTRHISMSRHVADVRSALDELEARAGNLPVGMVGFCFGAEVALESARGRHELAALVAWYGVPPREAADLPDPVLLILAADDDRVNRHSQGFLRRLETAGKDYVAQSFPGTLHAFHDWSRPERHSPAAAAAAWDQFLAFLARLV